MSGLKLGWPNWDQVRKICIVLLITIGAGTLYWWHLGTLTPGISAAESTARASSASLHDILTNPLNVPQRLLQLVFQSAGHHGAFWMRLPSVLLAILFLGLFYMFAKAWFGRVVGILSTAILATTPWIILIARSETPQIMLLSPIVVLVAYGWLMRSGNNNHQFRLAVLFIVTALCLYTPGVFWLVLAGIVLNRKKLLVAIKKSRQSLLVVTLLLTIAVLSPLVIAVVKNISIGKSLILWPADWASVLVTIKSICWAGLALVWRTPYHADIIIDRLPILSDTQIVLAVFGVYALLSKARKQLYVLSGLILIGLVGAGINRNLSLITLALPAIAVLVAAGLRYLYIEWRGIFPVNPIAKSFAVTVMVLVVSLNVLFGIRYALVAWPHTMATRETYVLK